MTITELIARYRRESGDDQGAYLTSDAELLELFNEAVEEACTRKDLLFDSTTEAVCQIAVTAETRTYDIHTSIVRITKAYLVDSGGNYIYLGLTDRYEMDRVDPNWREYADEPRAMVVDETSITFDREPESDYTLYLEVYRIPLPAEKMNPDADPAVTTPIIASQHHKHLHHHPLSITYMDDDADTYSPGKAKYHSKKFSDYFGLPRDADRGRKFHKNTPHHNKVWS